MNNDSTAINKFLSQESAGGIILMFAAALALLLANSPLSTWYDLLLDTPVEVRVGALQIAKPLLLWINDGLMAVFFFTVGLELKREIVEGELSDPSNILLPGIGAIGGMAIPALIYLGFNWNHPVNSQGWAIPAATDIAFALGILTLLGKRVPTTLKIFLTSLAIFDDIGAIIIIAAFFTSKISVMALLICAICIPILALLNRRGVESRSAYLLVGLVMWVSMLKSGVHATLTGVILAMFIPVHSRVDPGFSPLKSLEHDLHPTVAFFILPIFAFANAGISLFGVSANYLLHSVPLGVAAGLFVGKQLGIFVPCWIAINLKLAVLPAGMTWSMLYGTAVLCGVGFTMSLFIGSLAFEEVSGLRLFDERLGIIVGSLLSGAFGYLVLRGALKSANKSR